MSEKLINEKKKNILYISFLLLFLEHNSSVLIILITKKSMFHCYEENKAEAIYWRCASADRIKALLQEVLQLHMR